jgi:hypothetical protein
MRNSTYTREVLAYNVVRLKAAECEFTFHRPRPGVLLVEVAGHDDGQFGTGALDEIISALARERPLELFVDARAAASIAPSVREEWTRFFSSNRAGLTAVHVLTGSKVVHLAVAVAQLFSNTGNLIRLYATADSFEARLEQARRRAGLQ